MFDQQPSGFGLDTKRIWLRWLLAALFFVLVYFMTRIANVVPGFIIVAFWVAAGAAAIIKAIFGKEFRWAAGLGSHRDGPPAPTWLGRAFFLCWGLFAIWIALHFAHSK